MLIIFKSQENFGVKKALHFIKGRKITFTLMLVRLLRFTERYFLSKACDPTFWNFQITVAAQRLNFTDFGAFDFGFEFLM